MPVLATVPESLFEGRCRKSPSSPITVGFDAVVGLWV